jgi:GNAT superfamily N-acetyltransferase
MPLQILELDSQLHNWKAFDCGNQGRNRYIWQLARQHRKLGFSITYVLSNSEHPAQIIGFYSLSAAQLDLGGFPEQDSKKLPRVPVPAARVGQLAVSLSHQGQGYGSLLLQHAVKKALVTRDQVMGVHMVIVDADSESAAGFYRKFGFRDCNAEGQTLYLCLGKG